MPNWKSFGLLWSGPVTFATSSFVLRIFLSASLIEGCFLKITKYIRLAFLNIIVNISFAIPPNVVGALVSDWIRNMASTMNTSTVNYGIEGDQRSFRKTSVHCNSKGYWPTQDFCLSSYNGFGSCRWECMASLSSVNDSRYAIFMAKYALTDQTNPLAKLKGVDSSLLPPSKAVLYQKILKIKLSCINMEACRYSSSIRNGSNRKWMEIR